MANIGSRKPNPLGIYDTAGNAAEMVLDAFRFSMAGRLHGSAGGFVRKGGSFLSGDAEILPGRREEMPFFLTDGPAHARDLGFRPVISGINTPGGGRPQELTAEWNKAGEKLAPLAQDGQTARNPLDELDRLLAAAPDEASRKNLQDLRNTIKENNIMGILEHPLYKSFGYQVSSYFAPSSRYGTPDGFKELVDTAHGLGLAVILDVPHGHASANTEQGLAQYDGSRYFFTGQQNQWGTPSFDFSQEATRRFLLSNCRYWLEEFRVDGFRFDAVGNMLYADFGEDDDFSHVGRCFYGKNGLPRADVNGELYLNLANALTHELAPSAMPRPPPR